MQDSTIERKDRDSHRGIFVVIGAAFTGLRLLIGLTLLIVALAPPLLNKQMPDPAKIARKSKDVSAESIDASADGKFVSITGELTSSETIGDPLLGISGHYIVLERGVEMYSWHETYSFSYHGEQSLSSTENGSGLTTETRKGFFSGKTYRETWSDTFEEIYSTERPEQYINPRGSIESERFPANEARIGAYRVDPETLRFSPRSALVINPETFIPAHGARLEDAHMIFAGEGSLPEPRIGDLRIEYDAVESGTTVTVFGKLNGDAVEPYIHDGDVRFYHAFAGSREDALDRMQTEHRVDMWIQWALRLAPIIKPPDVDDYRDPASEIRRQSVEELAENRDFVTGATWALRGIGLFILWIGLCLFVGPIRRAVDSALAMDTARRPPRLVLPMLVVALILSAVLWWL